MEYLMFLSQLPASPSSLRVMVWRKLKAAGALGLQNGVWILPDEPEHEQFLQDLLEYVESQASSAQVFKVNPLTGPVEEDIQKRSRGERDMEYTEFLEQCQELAAELEKETHNQKFTFAELEENEQNLQKLTGWLAKIKARDFFAASLAETAVNCLSECQKSIETFSEQVYAQDLIPGNTGEPNYC